jgi:hypothetical protein
MTSMRTKVKPLSSVTATGRVSNTAGAETYISVAWPAPPATGSPVASFKIDRNGVFLDEVVGRSARSYSDTTAVPGVTYSYAVTVVTTSTAESPTTSSGNVLRPSAPTFVNSPSAISREPGQTYNFGAHVQNLDNDTLTYSLTASPGAGYSINSSTGVVTIGTSPGSVTVRVVDSYGLSSTTTATVSSTNQSPVWTATPLNLGTLAPGGTVDLSIYASDPGGDLIEFSRTGDAQDTAPASVTVSSAGLLQLPTTPGSYQLRVDAADSVVVPVEGITTLTLAGGGTGKPWTVWQVFAKGDVPSGLYLTADGPASFQADIRNRWSDGSVKYAVLSGVGGTSVAIQSTATPPSSSTVAEPSLNASVVCTVRSFTDNSATTAQSDLTMNMATARANGSMAWTSATAHKVREVLGPVMSEFHYYVPGDDHLHAFFYVRAYSSGDYEVEVVVDNGFRSVASGVATMAANPGRRDYTCQVSINGTARAWHDGVTQRVIQHNQNSRWSFVGWYGTDPQVIPQHDVAYLKTTKVFPNWTQTVSQAGIDGLALTSYNDSKRVAPLPDPEITTYAPVNAQIGSSNWGSMFWVALMPRHTAVYCTGGGASALHSIEANARVTGTFPIFERNSVTGEVFTYTETQRINFTNGVGRFWPAAYGSSPWNWDNGHHPLAGTPAYLLTGRWQFLELDQGVLSRGYFTHSSSTINHWLESPRGYPSSITNLSSTKIIRPFSIQTRGLAYLFRTLGFLCAVTPDASWLTGRSVNSTRQADYVKAARRQFQWMYDVFVGGTIETIGSRTWVNNLGCVGHGDYEWENTTTYPNTHAVFPNWMHDHLWAMAMHCHLMEAWPAEPEVEPVLNFGLQHTLGQAGQPYTLGDNKRNWQLARVYRTSYGTTLAGDTSKPPQTWHANWRTCEIQTARMYAYIIPPANTYTEQYTLLPSDAAGGAMYEFKDGTVAPSDMYQTLNTTGAVEFESGYPGGIRQALAYAVDYCDAINATANKALAEAALARWDGSSTTLFRATNGEFQENPTFYVDPRT